MRYDAGFFDPLGRMCLGSNAFAWMMSEVRDLANCICNGRLVVTQEGGYEESSVPFHALATIEAFSEDKSGFDNPIAHYGADPDGIPSPDQAAALQKASDTLINMSQFWPKSDQDILRGRLNSVRPAR
ncbi:hypothetical protein [Sphingopyxis sp. USTB-05]|uniref:hypothetical protein n=1 Tax=Sphingopyxis sp. USTB-05 TaxID=2830667 RepID=UPI0020791D41|nr:hypothetical protein [Sphingopyxis sp. USTB-05]USI77625.1 hypothetical protein KEC45_01530 [Sphingopyxis sp. USTB-05]